MNLLLARHTNCPSYRRSGCCATIFSMLFAAFWMTVVDKNLALVAAERSEPRSDREKDSSSAQSSALDVDTSEDKDIWRIQNRCGVNSVYLFARLLGYSIRYDDALDAIPIGNRGTSMADMKTYLKSQELNVEIIKTTPEFFKSCRLPVIALLEEGRRTEDHFSVILAVSPSTVWLIDGTTGAVTLLTVGQFNEQWRGYLLVDRGRQGWLRWTSVVAICMGGITMIHVFVCFRRQKKRTRTR